MRTKKGIITSAKMQQTVTVTVARSVMHPIYKKRYPVSKKFLADSNGLDLAEGNVVLIGECRPLSKRKCFKVLKVLEKGIGKGMSTEEELREMRGEKKAEDTLRLRSEQGIQKSEERASPTPHAPFDLELMAERPHPTPQS